MLSSATKYGFTPRDKAYYADQNTINFVRPGLTMTIVSAKVATDGTLSVDYKLTDLGYDLLTPVAALGQWAIKHQSCIEAARTQFDALVGADPSQRKP